MNEPCRKTQGLLDSYLSDELLIETCHEIEAHVESCAACASELAFRRELRAELRRALAVDFLDVEGARTRIAAALDEASRPPAALRRPASRARRFATLAAAAGVALLAGVALDRAVVERGQPSPPPLRLGLGELHFFDLASQHDRCALRRHRASPVPTAQAEVQLAGYRRLLAAVDPGAHGFRLLDGHICNDGDHPLGHLILEKGGEIVSVFASDEPPGTPASRVRLDRRRVENLEIDKVSLGSSRAFVVAAADGTAAGERSRLVSALDRYLEDRAARPGAGE